MITLEMILLTKIMIERARRIEIKRTVISALEHANVPYLPVDVKKICKSYDFIRLIPFSVQMKHRKMTYEEVLSQCQTKDACADYYALKGKYIIYYNDIDKIAFINSNRYRWSIAHELGHILLGHHKFSDKTRIFRFNLSDKEYDQFETEADYFAQLLLVPHAALLGFKINTSNHLRVMCKISNPASRRRYSEFVEWKLHVNAKDNYDERIFSYYYNFIFKRKCKKCDVGLIQRYGKYCPICGLKTTLQWGDGDKMKYPLFETYENGKLKKCPSCSNEDTDIEGNFCQICGQDLVNKCINNECSNSEILPSNARYCPICGAQSSFYRNNLLNAWNHNETASSNSFMNIPDGIDELPFF